LRSLEGNLVSAVLLNGGANRRLEAAARLPAEFGLAVEVGVGSIQNRRTTIAAVQDGILAMAVDTDFGGQLDGFGQSRNELGSDLVAIANTGATVVEVTTADIDLD